MARLWNYQYYPAQPYSPFGSLINEMVYTQDTERYRYGFNGQEKDDEIAGLGNINTADFWEYDTRLGRRWNVDPIFYAWQSGYSCFYNNPLYFSDPLGLDGKPSPGKVTVTTNTDEKSDILYNVKITAKKSPREHGENRSHESGTLWRTNTGKEAIWPSDRTSLPNGWEYVSKGIFSTAGRTNMKQLMFDYPGTYHLFMPKTKLAAEIDQAFRDGGRDAVVGLGVAAAAPFGVVYSAFGISSAAPVIYNAGFDAAVYVYFHAANAMGVLGSAAGGGVLLGRNMEKVVNPIASKSGLTTLSQSIPKWVSKGSERGIGMYNALWVRYQHSQGAQFFITDNAFGSKGSYYMKLEFVLMRELNINYKIINTQFSIPR